MAELSICGKVLAENPFEKDKFSAQLSSRQLSVHLRLRQAESLLVRVRAGSAKKKTLVKLGPRENAVVLAK